MPSWGEIIIYIKNQLSTNQFFSAAAFASVLTAVLMTLKGVPKRIWDRIVRITTYKSVVYQTDELYYSLTEWFNEIHKGKVRNVEVTTKSKDDEKNDSFPSTLEDSDFIKSKKGSYVTEMPIDDYFYFWRNRRLIKVTYGREKLENASDLKSAYLKNYTFSGIFAAKAIRELLNEVMNKYAAKKEPYFYQSQHHYFNRLSKVGGKPLKEVVLHPDARNKIVSDIEGWIKSKGEYERRGIPYKRGHCYYGPPGTGKTTLVKSIAKEYGFNIFSINLNKSTDEDILYLLREIDPGSILLFEDIDAFFDGRKKLGEKEKDSGVSFSGFLNALDGVVEMNGILVIITTNHVEKMDPALMRAGRIDTKVEISYSSGREISEYLSIFYDQKISIKAQGHLPMVDVQNVCLENKSSSKEAVKILENLLTKSVY
jgi:ATP-dependent Zn protease